MTPLARLLAARIAAMGPMTVADYMADCLLHPAHGYYATRDPFGLAGDFITAPEISQMFGELVGLCLAQGWLDQGSPAPFSLVELGPGRGTLMADLWRATRGVPGFHAAARMVLVEASPALRAVQVRTITPDHRQPLGHSQGRLPSPPWGGAGCGGRPADPARPPSPSLLQEGGGGQGRQPALPQPCWVGTAADLPDLPLFLVANEFFDALPIRQFLHSPQGWRERVIGLHHDALTFGLSDPGPCPEPRFAADPPGTLVELCPAAASIMATAGDLIRKRGGAALVIDYGGWRSRGDTLQAMRAHAREDPLANPGNADLTAHVDFEALALAANLPHTRLTTQGDLLRRLGIDARADRLAAGLTGDALISHRAAHRRLTHGDEMGTLFRAIALHAPGTPPPPGFD